MGWGPDGWNITNELVKISVRMQLKWCLYTQHSKHCSSSAHVIITAPDVHMPSTKPRTEYMQSLWEGSLEDFFIHRGTQKEKHWQERGPAFFFTTSTRKHDELVLPGSPTRRASLSCTDPPEDKTLWQPQAKQLGWDLPLLASVMSGRLQTLNSESSSLRDFFFFLSYTFFPPAPYIIQETKVRKVCENWSHRTALKPNSAMGGSMGVLFNKERTSCLANLIGYGGIMSSTEQQEQGRNTHYTFF